MSYAPRPIAERFWEKVHKTDKCWLWTASVNNKGYGEIHTIDGVYYSHRMAWILQVGPIPDGLSVLHKCDTPRCVRSDHLFLGTQLDNMKDCVAKGRHGYGVRPAGSSHAMAKLTETDVIAIRDSQEDRRVLANRFGVTASHIWSIQARRTWRHL